MAFSIGTFSLQNKIKFLQKRRKARSDVKHVYFFLPGIICVLCDVSCNTDFIQFNIYPILHNSVVIWKVATMTL